MLYAGELAPLPTAGAVAAFTVNGTFTSGRRTIAHRQYLTSDYVVTEFEGSIALFSPALGGRFLVDRDERVLRRLDHAGQRAQLAHLRVVVGAVIVEYSNHPCEIDGYPCRLHSLHNENGKIRIEAEAWCTRVSGTEGTALRHERAFDSGLHPFSLPLEPDEVVVRSMMRTAANGVEQRQTYRLRSLARRIDEAGLLESFLTYPITGA
jgi:hypothetical protein